MSEHLYGLEFPDPPKGWVALEAILLIKGLSPTGVVTYVETKTAGLTPMEALGMSTSFADTCRDLISRRQIGE